MTGPGMPDSLAARLAMFHVKHPRRLAMTALVGATLLVTACTGQLTPARGWAPPVPGPNDTLLVQSSAGRITAVQPDGTRVTDFELQGPVDTDFLGRERQEDPSALYAAPLVDGNSVYLASYKGRVARLEVEGGAISQAWTVDLHEKIVATPILRDGRLYVSSEDGRLTALNVDSGSVISRSRPTPGRVWGSPVAAESHLFIGTLDSSEILALDAGTGDTVWRHDGTGGTAADLVVDGDMLLVSSFDRSIHALDRATGDEAWAFAGDGWFVGKPLVTEDAIYAGTMSGSMYALDRGGQQRWQFSGEDLEFRATPILFGDTLIAVGRHGTFVGLDAATGAIRWQHTYEGMEIDANGVVADDAVFFTTTDYRLLRLNPADGTVQTFDIQPPSSDD